MSIVRTQAIILKGMKYNESSKIVSLYTKSHGKLSVLVKGARSLRSGISTAFDNMNFIDLHLRVKETRELQVLYKAECIESFSQIKSAIEKIASAYKIIEIIYKSTHEYDKNEKIFCLLLHCLKYLNENETNPDILYLYFQIYLLDYLGLSIVSENYDSDYSNFKNKSKLHNNYLEFTETEIKFLKYLSETKLENISKIEIKIDPEYMQDLQTTINLYILKSFHKFGTLVSESIMKKLY